MIVQTKRKLNNSELFFKLFYLRSTEIENKKLPIFLVNSSPEAIIHLVQNPHSPEFCDNLLK